MYLKFYVFSKNYSTHLRAVHDPTGPILAILYRKVPRMFHANYISKIGSVVLEKKSFNFITIYGHGDHLEFLIMTF